MFLPLDVTHQGEETKNLNNNNIGMAAVALKTHQYICL